MSTMVNGIGWFEIGTDDPAAAERFYGDVFGWTFADDPDSNMPYRIVTTPADGSIQGGVFGTGGALPSYAIFYVLVQDVARACRRAEAAGGKVLVPAASNDAGLTFAHLADPAGNHFGVFTPPVDGDG
jgi:predicted enzyme related to lactoylglutathione lyase